LNPFESLNIIESISNHAARHCAGRARLSAPRRHAASHTSPLTLGPRLVLASPVSRAPPLSPVARQRRHPRSTTGGCSWLPRATDCHARCHLSSLSRLNTDTPTPTPPPPLSLSQPRHRAIFFQNERWSPSRPRFTPSPRPRSSHQSRAPPSTAKHPVALLSTGALSTVGIWPVPRLSSLFSVHHPPSLSSPNPRPSLTSLSSSDL
jgi:hypothetical protein